LGRIKDIFMANVIECRGVYKNYMSGKMEVPVLRNVNFLMAEGEYTAIMGPMQHT
jgi:putative ABC transport system ATP-binding protein